MISVYGHDNAEGHAFFPRAALYSPTSAQGSLRVRESSNRSSFHPWSERHLQCVWFDPALRPPRLQTAKGEQVQIENPGVWNLEAGPDFLGAVARIEPGGRRMAGDVEIHVDPSGWASHGHANDPRYNRVRFHISYFPGDASGHGLPAGCIQLSLRDALAATPGFDFGAIDVSAYPFAARSATTPCARRLASRDPDVIGALLDAAGEERLRRKAARLQVRIEAAGAEQTLYEEVFCALGYKHNKAPFRHLADAVPLLVLREETACNTFAAYALLAGVTGLLPNHVQNRWDAETRAFVRRLWDCWWKLRERWEPHRLPATAWRTAGIRPANHPLRRLMAAASLFTRRESLGAHWARLAQAYPDRCEELASDDLQNLDAGYWARRFSFSSKPQQAPVALIGKSRADEIVLNVLIPFLATQKSPAPFNQGLLDRLPSDSDNGTVRQTAFALLGPDHPPSLYRSGLRKQGLLQIFHDFCLNDRSRCATCELPAILDSDNASG